MEDQEEMYARLGTSAEAASLRARLQSQSLVSGLISCARVCVRVYVWLVVRRWTTAHIFCVRSCTQQLRVACDDGMVVLTQLSDLIVCLVPCESDRHVGVQGGEPVRLAGGLCAVALASRLAASARRRRRRWYDGGRGDGERALYLRGKRHHHRHSRCPFRLLHPERCYPLHAL